jgi:hypothetical protein
MTLRVPSRRLAGKQSACISRRLLLRGLHAWLRGGQQEWELEYGRDGESEGRIRVRHSLSPRQVDVRASLSRGCGAAFTGHRLDARLQELEMKIALLPGDGIGP